MEWYQILTLAVSILTLLGFGYVAKFFWEDRHEKKKEETQEAKERKRQAKHAEMVSAVEEVTNPQFEQQQKLIENIIHRLEVSEECDRASLRNGLMGLYYACDAKHYRTEDDSKNYREMHEAYNKAGGNSFIDSDVSRWFDELPLKPNNYKPKAKKSAKGKKPEKSGDAK